MGFPKNGAKTLPGNLEDLILACIRTMKFFIDEVLGIEIPQWRA